jgi:hypothetical protein
MKSILNKKEAERWRRGWDLVLFSYLLGAASVVVYMETQLQCYRLIVIEPEQPRPMMVFDKLNKSVPVARERTVLTKSGRRRAESESSQVPL